MNAGAADWSRPLAGGPSHSKWRTRGNDYYSSEGPLQTLRCHHFRLCGVLVTCGLSGTATCRSKRPRTAQPPPCPLGPAGAILQRMGTTRGRGRAPRGAGSGNTRGRGHADGAGLQQHEQSQGHREEASLGPPGTGADSEVAGCFPKASLLEAGGSPRGPRGPEDILTVCVVFKSDSHGSMTHFRAAELQKFRSACVASAGPPGTTARLTWKKHMKEPLAIHPVPSLLSQALPGQEDLPSQNRHIGKLGLPLLGRCCPLRPACPKGAGQWAPPAFSDCQSAHGTTPLLTG